MYKLIIVCLFVFTISGCSLNKDIQQYSDITAKITRPKITTEIDRNSDPTNSGAHLYYTNEIPDTNGNYFFVIKNISWDEKECLYPDVLNDKNIPENCKKVLAACHDRRVTDKNEQLVNKCDLYKRSSDGTILKIETLYSDKGEADSPEHAQNKGNIHNFELLDYDNEKLLIRYGLDYSSETYMNIAWLNLNNLSIENIYSDNKIGDYGYISFKNRINELIIIQNNKSSHFSEAPEDVQNLSNGVYFKKNGIITKIQTNFNKFINPSYIKYINKISDIPTDNVIIFKDSDGQKNSCVDMYIFSIETKKLSKTTCIEKN